ncbi:hypothetical protein FRUB_02344 [Fimbriiglobus ruber]|uniref:DUF1552 domain-containing protein n=1 Tax=Fimbriiglobus ruber TaxID=1908690 RepID=A0A225DSK8_9BACT|nr:hypothetical protein FRUB_02344 [Fimbriiglobus ruber]
MRGAGTVVALPFLESWAARLAKAAGQSATAAVRPPLRMGIVTVTGGTILESWRAKDAGPLPAKLPSILRPLEFAKQDMLVVTGLSHSGEGENLNGHEYCAFKHLTASPRVGKAAGKPYAGVSVDQAAARAAGDETFLPSLEFGLSNHETQYSFRSADEPVPYEADPRLVFERMFRGRPPVVPNWQRRAAAKAGQAVRASAATDTYDRSVVDSVRDEARSLRGRVGVADRQKLDQYLDAVRSVETRIERLEARLRIEAEDLKYPGPAKLVVPQLPAKNAPFYKLRDLVYRDPEKHGEYIRLVSDLLVLAFQTDTTRVATLAIGADDASFPGVVTVGYETHCHTLEHQGNASRPEDADPIAREACRQIHAWYTSLFAEMVMTMKGIDEGGSTLLDNTMLLYTSYMADGGHGTEDYPAVLVGNAQGTLKTGRQLSFPKKTPAANLYLEMINRMGAKADEFGDSKTSKHAAFGGRLPGLV